MPDVSVVVPARDAAPTLRRTLAALAAQRGAPEFEVLVVDDGSTDDTGDVLRDSPVAVRALRTAGGEGPAAARNLGAGAARGSLLAFTDADCEPEPGWLAAIAQAATGADVVQGAVLPPEGAAIGPFDRYIAVVSMYGLFETANLAVDRAWFDRLGGFESILRPAFGKELGEDVWLGWRARRAGARAVFASDAVVRHAVFPRGARGYVGERARTRYFPALVARIPELRGTFLYRRWFLNRRTAHFDLALAGLGLAVASRRALPLVAAAPYARLVRQEVRHWPQEPVARVAAAHVAADVVTAGALAAGSIRYGALVG